MPRLNVLALLAMVVSVLPAHAQIDEAPKVQARLIPQSKSISPGGTIAVAFEEDIRPGWHTYWINPGDAGAPTEIQWTLPAGWRASPIEWPYPKKLPVGPLMDYGYEGRTWLLIRLTAPKTAIIGSAVRLGAAASWLVCQEVCVPEDVKVTLPLRIGQSQGPTDQQLAARFAAARAKLPVPMPWPTRYRLGTSLDLFVAAPRLAKARPAGAEVFPLTSRQVKSTAQQTLRFASDGLVFRLMPSHKFKPGRTLS